MTNSYQISINNTITETSYNNLDEIICISGNPNNFKICLSTENDKYSLIELLGKCIK